MTRLTTIPLTCLLFLLLAVPAVAAHEGAERADRSDTRAKAERFDRKAWRQARMHRHDELRCGSGLERAAGDLEKQTSRLLEHAVRDNPHPSRGERRALRRLYVLHREARELRTAAHRNHRLRPVLRNFRDVERAFDDARSRFGRLDPDKRSRRGMRRVSATMKHIEGHLAPAVASTWGHAYGGARVAWHR